MKPILYDPEETNFTTNGLGALSDAISVTVEEDRNGKYELTIKYPFDGIHFSEVEHSSIIKVKPYDNAGLQLFRVYKITSPLNKVCMIYAEHVSYQLNYIPLMPFRAYSIQSAFQAIYDNMAEPCPFVFWTDIQSAAVYEQTEPEMVRARLGGQEGSFLDVYGGEYEWDNYTVKLHQHRGTDRDVTLRYGKNITDISQEENIASTYTGVCPYWIGETIDDDAAAELSAQIAALTASIDTLTTQITAQQQAVSNAAQAYDTAVHAYGKNSAQAKKKKKKLNAEKEALAKLKEGKENAELEKEQCQQELSSVEGTRIETMVTLPEKVLHVTGADEFPFHRVRPLDLSDKFEEKPSVADLRDKATAWMDANCIGEPEINLKVSFVALWDTDEYKDIAPLERVQLCDTLVVEFERLGIRVAAKVTAYKYNVLLERYESITLGEAKKTLAQATLDNHNLTMDVIQQVPSVSMIQAEIDRATKLINGGYGGYVVFVDNSEDGTPEEILIMDAPDMASATNIVRMNKNGIGFSVNGGATYYTAWTIDGHFVADYITAGELNASMIHAGILMDYHNATYSQTTDTTVKSNKAYYTRINTGTTASPKYVYAVVENPTGNPQNKGYYECANPTGRNFWNLETGEFQLQSTVKVDNTTLSGAMANAASSAVSSYDTSLNQQAVFNKLTNNQANQGIYLQSGQLYINASMIKAGILSGIEINTKNDSVSGKNVWTKLNGRFIDFMNNVGTGGTREGYIHIETDSPMGDLTNIAPSMFIYSNTVWLESFVQTNVDDNNKYYGIRSQTILGRTTTTAANVRIGVGATGAHYCELMQSTGSSRRFKEEIKAIEDPEIDPAKLYDIEPIQFVYKKDYIADDDQRAGKNIPGFIAEQVAEVYPIAAEIDEDGTVEDWNVRCIIPPMLALIQEQHKEIEDLKTEVAELKTQIQRILTKIGE